MAKNKLLGGIRLHSKKKAEDNLPQTGPLVSIVILFYNSEKTLERCLSSVLSQQYKDLEIVCINDGSSDGSLEIAQRLLVGNPNARIITQENAGVSAARNRGLQEAHGEWIYFVDSDDYLMPNAIAIMAAAAQQEKCDLVVCDFIRIQNGRSSTKGKNKSELMNQRDFVRRMMGCPANLYFACLWNKLIHRTLLQTHNLHFDATVAYGEDHIFILEYLKHVRNVAVVGKPLYCYIDTPGSLVHQGMNPMDIGKNKVYVMEKLFRLCHDLGMAHKPSELARLARFLIQPSVDFLVLPVPWHKRGLPLPDELIAKAIPASKKR